MLENAPFIISRIVPRIIFRRRHAAVHNMTAWICCSLDSIAAEAVSAHNLVHCPAPLFQVSVLCDIPTDEHFTASVVCVAGVVATGRIKWAIT